MTYKNYSRYRVNPKMMCNSALQGSLNLYHSKKAYKNYLLWSIDYYGSSDFSHKFARICEEELERLDRLVDR